MSSVSQTSQKAYQKYAWIVLLVIGILLSLSGLFIVFQPVDEVEFESSTGVAWSELLSSEPEVADYIIRLERLLGASAFGIALFGTVVTFFRFRKGERWAWYVMWLFPLVFGMYAAIFFISAAQGLGLFYGGGTLITLLALLLPIRKFFPKRAALSEA